VRKDNTGYHLNQLFIGSEGTLGIVTAASIQVPVKPQAVNVALLALPSFEHAQQLYVKARTHLGEILSAFEFFDRECFHLVLKHHKTAQNPFNTSAGEDHPFYVLIETHGSNGEHDESKLTQFLSSVIEEQVATDGTLGLDESNKQALWLLRESISESIKKEGLGIFKYDISIPVPRMYEIVEIFREKFKGRDQTAVYGFGHMGDDNLHLNIVAPKNSNIASEIEPYVYEWTAQHNGSVSSEHGIGFMKLKALQYSKQKESIDMMKQMKQMFDPNGILNPYKVFV